MVAEQLLWIDIIIGVMNSLTDPVISRYIKSIFEIIPLENFLGHRGHRYHRLLVLVTFSFTVFDLLHSFRNMISSHFSDFFLPNFLFIMLCICLNRVLSHARQTKKLLQLDAKTLFDLPSHELYVIQPIVNITNINRWYCAYY